MDLLKISKIWYMTPFLLEVEIEINEKEITINNNKYAYFLEEDKIKIMPEVFIMKHNAKTLLLSENGKVSLLF